MLKSIREELAKRSKNVREQTRLESQGGRVTLGQSRDRMERLISTYGAKPERWSPDSTKGAQFPPIRGNIISHGSVFTPDHELAHAIMTPKGETIGQHNERIADGLASASINEEQATSRAEAKLRHRAGLSPTSDTRHLTPSQHSLARMAVNAFDNGTRFSPSGHLVSPSGIDHKINERARNQKSELEKASKRPFGEFPHGAKMPSVDFSEQDLVHSGSPESVLRGYGDPTKHYDVYEGYVPASDSPRPRLAEEEEKEEHRKKYHSFRSKEECPDSDEDGNCMHDNDGGYDWDELRSRGRSFPAPTLMIPLKGDPHWADGNHRVSFWDQSNYTHYPAYVMREKRKPRLPKAGPKTSKSEPLDKRSKNVREKTTNITPETAQRRVTQYAQSIGLQPKKKFANDLKDLKSKGTELQYGGKFNLQHELGHAMQTTPGKTMQAHMRGIKPEDQEDDDVINTALEHRIDRRAGVNPHKFGGEFRGTIGGEEEDDEGNSNPVEWNADLKGRHGKAARDSWDAREALSNQADRAGSANQTIGQFDLGHRFDPKGKLVAPGGIDARINQRAAGQQPGKFGRKEARIQPERQLTMPWGFKPAPNTYKSESRAILVTAGW